jgi:hypothetical protein
MDFSKGGFVKLAVDHKSRDHFLLDVKERIKAP